VDLAVSPSALLSVVTDEKKGQKMLILALLDRRTSRSVLLTSFNTSPADNVEPTLLGLGLEDLFDGFESLLRFGSED
jgi:hypothetical protein